jgi:hypothetical protein
VRLCTHSRVRVYACARLCTSRSHDRATEDARWRARSAGPAATAPFSNPPTAFALGDASSTNCPPGLAKITGAAACQSAAAFAAGLYADSVTASYMPGGCYWHTLSGGFYYNTNPFGGGNVFARPVCAGALESYVHIT